jgi:HSP20 family protein
MKALIPWRRATDVMGSFRTEMDDLFSRFFGTEPMVALAGKAWAPRVDVSETEKEFVVRADLPGVDPKDVEVTVADGALILKGERKEEREEKAKNFHKIERFVGEFYREVPLPVGADPDKVAATTAKGVVTITVPKKAGALPKKVPVTTVA